MVAAISPEGVPQLEQKRPSTGNGVRHLVHSFTEFPQVAHMELGVPDQGSTSVSKHWKVVSPEEHPFW
jgi:hypothetical protein